MLAKFGGWLDERFSWRQVWEAIFLRKIPHVNWWFTLGSATLFMAVLQGVTGILKRSDYEDTGRILLDTGAIRALPDFNAFTGRSDARHEKHRP